MLILDLVKSGSLSALSPKINLDRKVLLGCSPLVTHNFFLYYDGPSGSGSIPYTLEDVERTEITFILENVLFTHKKVRYVEKCNF
jgi:hypothetical protein